MKNVTEDVTQQCSGQYPTTVFMQGWHNIHSSIDWRAYETIGTLFTGRYTPKDHCGGEFRNFESKYPLGIVHESSQIQRDKGLTILQSSYPEMTVCIIMDDLFSGIWHCKKGMSGVSYQYEDYCHPGRS